MASKNKEIVVISTVTGMCFIFDTAIAVCDHLKTKAKMDISEEEVNRLVLGNGGNVYRKHFFMYLSDYTYFQRINSKVNVDMSRAKRMPIASMNADTMEITSYPSAIAFCLITKVPVSSLRLLLDRSELFVFHGKYIIRLEKTNTTWPTQEEVSKYLEFLEGQP